MSYFLSNNEIRTYYVLNLAKGYCYIVFKFAQADKRCELSFREFYVFIHNYELGASFCHVSSVFLFYVLQTVSASLVSSWKCFLIKLGYHTAGMIIIRYLDYRTCCR